MSADQWFHDSDSNDDDPGLPVWLAEDIAQFYGRGETGTNFAQALEQYLHWRGLRIVADPKSTVCDEPGWVATEPWGPLLRARGKIGAGS